MTDEQILDQVEQLAAANAALEIEFHPSAVVAGEGLFSVHIKRVVETFGPTLRKALERAIGTGF